VDDYERTGVNERVAREALVVSHLYERIELMAGRLSTDPAPDRLPRVGHDERERVNPFEMLWMRRPAAA
jgi:hypothetical protein